MLQRAKQAYRSVRTTFDFSDTVDRAFKLLGIPVVGGLVTTVLGLIWDYPHWAIMVGSSVFAITSIGLVGLVELQKRIALFRHLNVIGTQFSIGAEDGKIAISAEMRLQNTAQRMLFYRIRAARFSIGDRNNSQSELVAALESVPSMSVRQINVAAVYLDSVEKEIRGSLELECDYGYSGKQMDYRFRYEALILACPGKPPVHPIIQGVNRAIEHTKHLPE